MAKAPDSYCSMYSARHDKPVGELALLEKILAGIPRLQGARCVRYPTVFDGDDLVLAEVAEAICSTCPVKARCLAFALAQPAGSVTGILGGHRFGASSRRPA